MRVITNWGCGPQTQTLLWAIEGNLSKSKWKPASSAFCHVGKLVLLCSALPALRTRSPGAAVIQTLLQAPAKEQLQAEPVGVQKEQY